MHWIPGTVACSDKGTDDIVALAKVMYIAQSVILCSSDMSISKWEPKIKTANKLARRWPLLKSICSVGDLLGYIRFNISGRSDRGIGETLQILVQLKSQKRKEKLSLTTKWRSRHSCLLAFAPVQSRASEVKSAANRWEVVGEDTEIACPRKLSRGSFRNTSKEAGRLFPA